MCLGLHISDTESFSCPRLGFLGLPTGWDVAINHRLVHKLVKEMKTKSKRPSGKRSNAQLPTFSPNTQILNSILQNTHQPWQKHQALLLLPFINTSLPRGSFNRNNSEGFQWFKTWDHVQEGFIRFHDLPKGPRPNLYDSVEGKHPPGKGPGLCARDPYRAGTQLKHSKATQDSSPRELLVSL